MISDFPQIIGRRSYLKFQNKRVIRHFDWGAGRALWAGGFELPNDLPRHHPCTRNELKLNSRPTFEGPVTQSLASSQMRSHFRIKSRARCDSNDFCIFEF